ncbi:response regulator [Thiovibrio sp. JS02]
MKRILVIDDEPGIRNLLKEMLEISGYEVLVAANGNEGVAQFKTFHPDLIITDMVMPEKNGIEAIMDLKKINPAVKIIAISGGGHIAAEKYLMLASALNVERTLAKPFEPDQILSEIHDLLGE